MKFKKAFITLAASAMSLSAIAAPVLSNSNTVFQYAGITASAANVGTVTQNGITYSLYDSVTEKGVTRYNIAIVSGSQDTTGCITIPEGIYANGGYYKVYKISSRAFANNNMSAIDMHNAYSLYYIPKDAFSGCKKLTDVVLPYNLDESFDVRNTFITCSALKAFGEVPCANYTVIDGILYNKDATKMLIYPQGKTDSDYTFPATLESYLLSLNNSYSFNNIKNINIPADLSEEQIKKLSDLFLNLVSSEKKYGLLFNGSPIYTKDENNESAPEINPYLKDRFYEEFTSYLTISNAYAKYYADYVVNTVLDENDSDFAKAVKLHDWLCAHVEYDPVVQATLDKKLPYHGSTKNHCDASAFLHFEKADDEYYEHDGFYTVCDGYSRAYKLLMNAAGISCERVSGDPAEEGGYGHAWSIVRFNDKDEDPSNDKYYYVDVTWDKIPGNYTYFMCGGKEGYGEHGTEFINWQLDSKNAFDVLPEEGDSIPDFGDADHDGSVSVNDYTRIKDIITEGGYDENADVNADGQVNDEDADIIAKYIYLKRGDTNADGIIDKCDVSRITASARLNIFKSDYDINFDGKVDSADVEMIENMVGIKTQSIKNIRSSLINDIVYHTSPEFNIGDIDDSGNYNYADAQMIYNIVTAEAEGYDIYTEEQRSRADINRDGSVNSADSELINEYLNNSIAGDTTSFCQFVLNKLMK